MSLGANTATRVAANPTATWGQRIDGRLGPRGKNGPLGYQEPICRNAERGVVMKPKPVGAFMIALFRANNAVSPDSADASPRCALRRTSRSPWPMRDWWRCT
jgi:hypothetical protein